MNRLKQQAAEQAGLRKQLLNRFENLRTDLKALSKANNLANMLTYHQNLGRLVLCLVGMSKPYQSPADQLNSTLEGTLLLMRTVLRVME